MQDADWTAARELRREAHLDVQARRSDGTSFALIVRDISRDGCQLRTEAAFQVGELIELEHDIFGILRADVRWSCSGRVGLRFVNPL